MKKSPAYLAKGLVDRPTDTLRRNPPQIKQRNFNSLSTGLGFFNSTVLLITTVAASLSLFNLLPLITPYITSLFFLSIITLVLANFSNSKYVRRAMLFSGLLLALLLVVAIFYPAYISSLYIRIVLIFLAITTIPLIKVNHRQQRLIALVFIVILGILFFKSFGFYGNFITSNITSGGFESRNPNSYGFLALVSVLFLDRNLFFKKKISRYLLFIAGIITIANYSARASLLGMFVYIFISYFIKNLRKPRRKTIYVLLIVIAIVFPIIYINLYSKSVREHNQYEILGKSIFSGRQELWVLAEKTTNTKSILLGQPDNKILDSTTAKDWHNMYISIWFSTGLVCSIILVALIYYSIIINEEIKQKTFAYIIAILSVGYFETVMISGSIIAMLAIISFVNNDASERFGRQKHAN